MALRPLLRFQNPDSTRDLNDRFRIFNKGVFFGGDVQPSAGLTVTLSRFATVGADGMFVREDDQDTLLSVTAGEKNYIVLRSRFVDNNAPIVSVESLIESEFLGDPELEYLIVFAVVDVPVGSSSVTDAMLDFTERDSVDPLGRLAFRGHITNTGQLPSVTESLPGDFFIITDGVNDFPEIWAFNGSTFRNITQAQVLINLLDDHLNNLTNNRKHLTNSQFQAVLGTTGVPGNFNRFVTSLDARIPSQTENDALQPDPTNLSGGVVPSNTNRFIAASKIFATPAEKAFNGGALIELSDSDGPIYVGRGGPSSSQVYFNIVTSDTSGEDSDKELINSQFQSVKVTGVFTEASFTNELNPNASALVDGLGFFSGASLFLQVSNPADIDFRIVYAKRTSLGNLRPESFILRGPQFGQVDSRLNKLLSSDVNAQFPDSIWDVSVNPGDVVGFSSNEFVKHNIPSGITPLGVRGNSNNLIMEGLYTFPAPTSFSAGDDVYADPITPGALTTVVNDRFIGTFISSTQLLVNMNGISIAPSSFAPGISFSSSMFGAGLDPGEVAAFDSNTGKFEAWDDNTMPWPVGIRGNSNNIIQNGLFTSTTTPFVSGLAHYASTTVPGQISVIQNDFFVGRAISNNQIIVSMISQPNWTNARSVFSTDHNSNSGIHNEGSARTFVGVAADAGITTSGSLPSSTGMVLFATDTGQVFYCVNGALNNWVEISRFNGPLAVTSNLEVGGNLRLPTGVLDNTLGDTFNVFSHAARHLAGGSDSIPGVISQVFVGSNDDVVALSTPLSNLTNAVNAVFDFTGRTGASTILWVSVVNVENAAGAVRSIEARTFLDGVEQNVLVTSPINKLRLDNSITQGQMLIIGHNNNVSAGFHDLQIRMAADAINASIQDRYLFILDLGSN